MTTLESLIYKEHYRSFRRAPLRARANAENRIASNHPKRGVSKIMSTAVAGKGLEGIVAANSGICLIDGEAGVLAYRGIDIHELAEHSTFEETTYLLWNGRLPSELELREFSSQLALARSLDQRIVDMLQDLSHLGHAHGGAANRGLGAQLLRRRRKGQLATTPTCARPTT